MTNRIDQQIDDIYELLAEMAQHSRRKRAEKFLGPIKVAHTEAYFEGNLFEACFDNYYDIGMPSWVRAWGPTEAEAIRALIDGAEDEMAEREAQRERERLDSLRMGELDRRSGC